MAVTRDDFVVCIKCPKLHIENCHTCFGFGLRATEHYANLPISAEEACSTSFDFNWHKCDECGSTPDGLPKEANDVGNG